MVPEGLHPERGTVVVKAVSRAWVLGDARLTLVMRFVGGRGCSWDKMR